MPARGEFQPFDLGSTVNQIALGLDEALGVNWPLAPGVGNEASVRIVADGDNFTELTDREPTQWTWPTLLVNPANYFNNNNPKIVASTTPAGTYDVYSDALVEITFLGEWHDLPVSIFLTNETSQNWLQPLQTVLLPSGAVIWPPPIQIGANVPIFFDGDFNGNPGTAHYAPSISMTPDGNMVTVYSEAELTSDFIPSNYQNFYYRYLTESTDTAGPQVATVSNGMGSIVPNGSTLIGSTVSYLVVTFDKEMLAGDPADYPDSVLNPDNYVLLDGNGNQIAGAVVHVDYGLSEVAQMADVFGMDPLPSNKWEAILTLDGNPHKAGDQPLGNGTYTLELLNAITPSSTTTGQTGLEDINGVPLNLSGFNPAGADFDNTFTVRTSSNDASPIGPPASNAIDKPINTVQTGLSTEPAVATAANGSYVIVWSDNQNTNGLFNIYGQRFDANGNPQGPEFLVNTYTSGNQNDPSVAMDDAGNFVVVWSGQGPNYNASATPPMCL